MEQELKSSIAVYVDRIGVKAASDIAFSKLVDNINLCVGPEHLINDIPGYMVGRLKFHVAVIEYLYCDEEEVDGYCMAELESRL